MNKLLWLVWNTSNYTTFCYKKETLLRNNYTKNVNINEQWMLFPNLLALDNPRRVHMTLKSINQSIWNSFLIFFYFFLCGADLEYIVLTKTCDRLIFYEQQTRRDTENILLAKLGELRTIWSHLLVWKISWLVGWLVDFYGISTFVGYLTPNPFLCK